jgi:putative endonuclease
MTYFVYILKSLKNDRYYVGYTNNIEKRLIQHNNGKTTGNKYWGPFELTYKEEYDNPTKARKREYYIKRQKSKRFIEALVNGAVVQLGERPDGIGEVRD